MTANNDSDSAVEIASTLPGGNKVTLDIVSRNHVPIRLTNERWSHIVEEHSELAGLREDVLETVSDAERVLQERLASR